MCAIRRELAEALKVSPNESSINQLRPKFPGTSIQQCGSANTPEANSDETGEVLRLVRIPRCLEFVYGFLQFVKRFTASATDLVELLKLQNRGIQVADK